MEMNVLRTFVAAFEEESFTKAARRLNATQPGVSVQIAALEAELGAPLFDRNPRSVSPTVAARRLYVRALQLIHDLKSAELEIRSLAGSVTGRVSVGIPPGMSKAILAPVLARYLEAYPEVEVRILDAYSDTLLSLIKTGELDFALVAHLASDPALNYRKVFRDEFVLVSGPQCDLKPGKTIRLNVEPYFKIVVPSVLRHALHKVLDESFRIGDIVPARLVEIDGLAGALDFVRMTDWVALMPAATSYNSTEESGLSFNRIAGAQIAMDYFVANARTEPLSPAAQAFVDLAVAELDLVASQWRSNASHRPARAPPAKT
jgi:LysR family transcriptional regulator, nitrogen assimilation regulatory protein